MKPISLNEHPNIYDVLVVGAGIAGLHALYKLNRLGFRVRAIEMGGGVGGTWYWNRYPGARCDTESVQYSYGFDDMLQEEWEWTECFASQTEILRYLNHVADRFDLRGDIDFNTKVAVADYDDKSRVWTLRSEDGKSYRARFCVMASGCLTAAPNLPEISGLQKFNGNVYYTARWPHEEVSFHDQRVAVVGTGSSGIQVIPEIARQADHVQIFQRTANYSIPARNGPIAQEYRQQWKKHHRELRQKARSSRTGTLFDLNDQSAMSVDPETREKIFSEHWARGGANFMVSFNDMLTNETSNEMAADFVRRQISKTVKDPELVEKFEVDPIGWTGTGVT
jgi:cyclohexanone monooxygenase